MIPMIKLESVWKEYEIGENIIPVVKNVTLDIKKGEYTAIIGPSGSGKSTLMHIIGLLDKPSRGKILIDGADVSRFSDDKLSRFRNQFVGFVFQQFNLLPKYTVLENILLPVYYCRDKLDYDPRQKAIELLKRVGIPEKADSFPNKLSGGQQQRVAIARGLIMKPNLILADEPTGNLDTKNGNAILDLLEELNKKDKITVVLVTHEAEVAARTKRKIRIVDGELVK